MVDENELRALREKVNEQDDEIRKLRKENETHCETIRRLQALLWSRRESRQ